MFSPERNLVESAYHLSIEFRGLAGVVRYVRKILQQETDQVNTGGAVMVARGSQARCTHPTLNWN